MKPGLQDWECLAPGDGHFADLIRLAMVYHSPKTDIEIHRCACGQAYHVHQYEVSDWSGDSDYYDQTIIWTPLAYEEVEAAAQDSNYRPRSEKNHRYDSGWRAG